MTTTAPSHDFLRYHFHPLDAIFKPKSVAVIGATERERSVGRTIMWNLITNSFGGMVFPVNLKRKSVLGIKAYKRVANIPEPIDLAIVVTPARTVPAVIRECVQVGVKGAIVISAGFKETGEAGVQLEAEVLAEARKGNMRIVGPNCLGVMNPVTGLNASFASRMARPGNVGFISQSGALCTSILDWSLRENVGFSAFVSIGSMLDVSWGDLIYYLGNDRHTKSIVIYMESIGDARAFMSAAREVALTKPIILIKPGRTEAAAQAAASHTGSLTGSDEVLDAAFRRVGALRVDHISQLFNMAELLAKQPRPRKNRLTIITNAGGPGVLATDALIGGGGQLAPLSDELTEALDEFLPEHWSHANPIDILGDAGSERYQQTFETVIKNKESDGLLVILTPQAMTSPTQTAQNMIRYLQANPSKNRPILASWMGGADIRAGEEILNQANIPTFTYPDTAARLFNYMWQYSDNLRSLYETPEPPSDWDGHNTGRDTVTQLINQVRQQNRTILTEYESKQILSAYDIPTVPTYLADTADKAVGLANEIGYPVVLKINSYTITHKIDVGGVQLNLADEAAVRQAYADIENGVAPADFQGVTVQPMVDLSASYEIIIGSSPDAQFGPVLLFGTGGSLVEVYKDRALALPPLNTTLARRMMERTKIYEALHGVRGRDPVDLAELEKILVRFSFLIVEQPWIKELDINPLLCSDKQIIALDGRVLLYEADTEMATVPHPAIRPYPSQYISSWTTKQDIPVRIRPIRPEDEPKIVHFHANVSEDSVYMRYFHPLNFDYRISHERLTRICFIDYDREMALVITTTNAETDEREIIAVGRLSKLFGQNAAEFAMLIRDDYQRQGLGTLLLQRLLDVARAENIGTVIADMLPENTGMRYICQKLGFTLKREQGVIKAKIEL